MEKLLCNKNKLTRLPRSFSLKKVWCYDNDIDNNDNILVNDNNNDDDNVIKTNINDIENLLNDDNNQNNNENNNDDNNNDDNTDEDNTESGSEPEDDNVDKNYIFEDNTFKIKSFLINNDDKKSELKAIILSYILENINQNERIEFIKHYITDKQGSSWSILNIFKK